MESPKFKRGKVFIFNMYRMVVNGTLDTRIGSDKDVERLTETFESIGAIVKKYLNFGKDEVIKEMNIIRKEDFSEFDYVAIVFSSHGGQDSTGFTVEGENIFLIRTFLVPLFRNKTLARKLKWLITQTCKGTQRLVTERETGMLTVNPEYYVISYSTTEGAVSYRSSEGSLFIQTLCDTIDQHRQHDDLIQILNRVRDTVQRIAISQDGNIIQLPTLEENFGTSFTFKFAN